MTRRSTEAPLALLLERVGVELDALAWTVADLQTGLSPLLTAASATDPSVCRHAQSLDITHQVLESLSKVLLRASRDEASHHSLDLTSVAADLTLAALTLRLQGSERAEGEVAGDLDLF